MHIEKDSAKEVHSQVIESIDASGSKLIDNLCCSFPAGGLDGELAELFPFHMKSETALDTMMELVKWWQSPSVLGANPRSFNHGSRIRGKDSDWNQVPKVVETLSNNMESTKGNITIQHYRPGYAETHGHPSLCEIFLGTRTSAGQKLLDITAVFRKQEMRYWWIVNVYELQEILQSIILELSSAGREVFPGKISTFTFRGIAADEGSTPEVAVHALDRAHYFRPNAVKELASGLLPRQHIFGETTPWNEYFVDVIPKLRQGDDGFPICLDGLVALKSYLEIVSTVAGCGEVTTLSKYLEKLINVNRVIAEKIANSPKGRLSPAEYAAWKAECQELVNSIRLFVYTRFGFENLYNEITPESQAEGKC